MPYEREPAQAKKIKNTIQKICNFTVGQKVWLLVEIKNKPCVKPARVSQQIVTVGPRFTLHGVSLPQVTISYRVIVHGLKRREHLAGSDQLFFERAQACAALKGILHATR